MSEHPQREVRACVAMVDQVARGLMALHRKETIHRDLKPDNVMVSRDGSLRILDFGSCHVAGLGEIESTVTRDRMVGTLSYSAPEALDDSAPNVRQDIFALGVLTYELLTGTLPYGAGLERVRSAADYARLPYKPAYHTNALIPTWMDAALKKALKVDPRLRYEELSEFLHDLERPNPDFVDAVAAPVLAQNPLRFWRTLALALFLSQLATLYYVIGRSDPPASSLPARGRTVSAHTR